MKRWINSDNEEAPTKVKTEHGKLFGLTDAKKQEMGYEEVEDTEEIVPTHLIEETASKTVFTKLEIRRALRALGMEETLDELLNSDIQLKNEWNDCQEIDFNDPAVANAKTLGLVTDSTLNAVAEEILRNRA